MPEFVHAPPQSHLVVSGAIIRRYIFTAEATERRERSGILKCKGLTEIAYRPAGN